MAKIKQTNSCLPSLTEGRSKYVSVCVGGVCSFLSFKKKNYVDEKKGSSQLAFHII